MNWRRAPALLPAAVLLGAALSVGGELGCKPKAATAPPPAPPPRSAEPVARANGPLALPDELVVAARWRQPTALLRQFASWASGDLTLELWLRGRVGRPSRPIDLDAPIEFLALWDGKSEPPVLRWALSFALTADAAAAALTGPRDVPSPIGWSCAEDAALGPIPLRMICAPSDGELEQLLPFATRALPLAELGAGDVALRVHAKPLRGVDDATLQARASAWLSAAFGLDSLNRRGDAELAELAQTLKDELRSLAEDLDEASIELSLRPEGQGIELRALAPRAAPRSELLQLLIGSGASGIAPSDFWQLWNQSEGAGYLWAWSELPLARLRTPFGALLETLLDFRGLPERLAQQGRLLIERVPLPLGPIVHASGRLPQSPDPKSAPAPWLADLGWEAYGFAGKFAEYDAWADQLASAFNDPVLGPQFGRLVRSAWGARWVPQQIKRRRPQGGQGLPRGSFTLELTFAQPHAAGAAEAEEAAPARAAVARPTAPTLFVVCVPEPDGVKLAWGADEKFLLRLAAPAARQGTSNTLAARAGLGALHEQRTLAGGFASLAAFAGTDSASSALGEHAASALDVTPHRGLSPILYRLSQRSEVPALAFNASLGRDTIEDLLFLIAKEALQP